MLRSFCTSLTYLTYADMRLDEDDALPDLDAFVSLQTPALTALTMDERHLQGIHRANQLTDLVCQRQLEPVRSGLILFRRQKSVCLCCQRAGECAQADH